MRNVWMVAVLVGGFACGGGKAKPTPPVSDNKAPADKPVVAPDAQPVTNPASKTSIKVEMIGSTGFSAEGVLFDQKTKEPLAGVTLIATSPALQGTQAVITDDGGRFAYKDLPVGKYNLDVYYMDVTSAAKFEVGKGKTARITMNLDVNQGSQVITISEEPRPEFKSAYEALKAGAVGDAVKLGQDEVAKKATAKLHGIMALSRYAFAIEGLRYDAFAFGGTKKTAKDFKNGIATFQSELVKIDGHLKEALKDPKFELELCVACMATEKGYFQVLGENALDIERDRTGKELPETDKRRRPTYHFDYGDLHWARAMTQYQLALTHIVLAYDWSWFDKLMKDFDSPNSKGAPQRIIIKLVDAARITKAREAILEGLTASEQARAAYLAETDDDREWVPSPKQKNYASPLPVDDKLYQQWESIIADVRALVAGDTGISFEALYAAFDSKHPAPKGFIDVGAMLQKPTTIMFELGMIDRMEAQQDPAKRAKYEQHIWKGVLGNGFKPNMKSSPITDRIIQLRKDLAGADDAFEDKMKYVLWLN